MKVLVWTKKVTHGNCTYSMSECKNFIHINNHKANDKSIVVPLEPLQDLFRSK